MESRGKVLEGLQKDIIMAKLPEMQKKKAEIGVDNTVRSAKEIPPERKLAPRSASVESCKLFRFCCRSLRYRILVKVVLTYHMARRTISSK